MHLTHFGNLFMVDFQMNNNPNNSSPQLSQPSQPSIYSFLIISDIHYDVQRIKKLIETGRKFDYIFCLGDIGNLKGDDFNSQEKITQGKLIILDIINHLESIATIHLFFILGNHDHFSMLHDSESESHIELQLHTELQFQWNNEKRTLLHGNLFWDPKVFPLPIFAHGGSPPGYFLNDHNKPRIKGYPFETRDEFHAELDQCISSLLNTKTQIQTRNQTQSTTSTPDSNQPTDITSTSPTTTLTTPTIPTIPTVSNKKKEIIGFKEIEGMQVLWLTHCGPTDFPSSIASLSDGEVESGSERYSHWIRILSDKLRILAWFHGHCHSAHGFYEYHLQKEEISNANTKQFFNQLFKNENKNENKIENKNEIENENMNYNNHDNYEKNDRSHQFNIIPLLNSASFVEGKFITGNLVFNGKDWCLDQIAHEYIESSS